MNLKRILSSLRVRFSREPRFTESEFRASYNLQKWLEGDSSHLLYIVEERFNDSIFGYYPFISLDKASSFVEWHNGCHFFEQPHDLVIHKWSFDGNFFRFVE